MVDESGEPESHEVKKTSTTGILIECSVMGFLIVIFGIAVRTMMK